MYMHLKKTVEFWRGRILNFQLSSTPVPEKMADIASLQYIDRIGNPFTY